MYFVQEFVEVAGPRARLALVEFVLCLFFLPLDILLADHLFRLFPYCHFFLVLQQGGGIVRGKVGRTVLVVQVVVPACKAFVVVVDDLIGKDRPLRLDPHDGFGPIQAQDFIRHNQQARGL